MRQFGFLLLILITTATAFGADNVTIIVNSANFDSVEKAANAEQQVNFWDDDFTDDRACTECFAALELKNFLVKVTDLQEDEIVFAGDKELPESGDIFVIGSSESNKQLRKSDGQFENDQCYKIKTKKDNGRLITYIKGADRIGTLYGVYEYLTRLGIRFYGLGDKGTVYPDEKVKLIEEIDVTESPDYLSRGFWISKPPQKNPDMHLWMARNKINFWTMMDKDIHTLKKLGINLCVGGHMNQIEFLNPKTQYPYNHPKFKGDEDKPKDPYKISKEYTGDTDDDGKLTYFEAHPEWYALIKGKRSSRFAWNGDNFCTSNRDASAEFAKNMAEAVAGGKWKYADIIYFWMFDGGHWCECENCKKQGSITDRFLLLVDVVFKEFDKLKKQGRLNRDIQISPLAYLETIETPTKPLPKDFNYKDCLVTFFPMGRCYAHTISDAACSEVNTRFCRIFKNWADGTFKGEIFVGEYYNVSSIMSLPAIYTKIMAADIPWFYENGAKHFNYMHTLVRDWGPWTLNQHLMAKLLWNTKDDSDRIVTEYYQRYYPTTSDSTAKFYRTLEEATSNIKAFKHFIATDITAYNLTHWNHCLTKKDKDNFWSDHLSYNKNNNLRNHALSVVEIMQQLRLARKYFDQSLLDCKDDIEMQRLIEDDKRLDYCEKMFNFIYHLVRTSTFFKQDNDVLARVEFKKTQQYAQLLRDITDVQYSTSCHADPKDGFEATRAQEAYKFFEEKYGDKSIKD